MSAWGSLSYVFGPVMAFAAIGVLVLLLRWAFSSGSSLVERPPRHGAPDDYGMLVPVAAPPTYIEGEMLRRTLVDEHVRATLAETIDGPRILVWPGDERRAREVLARRSPH